MDCAVKFISRNLVIRKVSLNSETVGIFYEILGDRFRVKPENGIFEKFQKMANI